VKKFPLLFAGIFATFALGWTGVVLVPQIQIGKLQPQVDEENADVYPVNAGGMVDQGRKVYVANGCADCHTQAVRGGGAYDVSRGWGTRQTAARDYMYETPAQLGAVRNGPDLTNIGNPELTDSTTGQKRWKDAEWHYLHLYNPRAVTPGSIMPSFRFLFEKRKITGQRSAEALNFPADQAMDGGCEVVPTPEAKALVGYLLSLDKTHPLKEIKTSKEGAAK
jgi:cytochrome c oxidase cbb3-type subunit 2